MKTKWLFAILITVACLHANSQKVNAQGTTPAVGNVSLGEDGSNEIRIEPNDTPLAAEVRALLRASETKGVRKSTARFTAKTVRFLKPIDTSTNYPPFRTNMMEGLKTERQVGTGETAFIPLPDGSTIRPADITVTPYNNGGRYPSVGFVSRISNPAVDSFSLGGVSYIHESSDVSTGKLLGELGFSGNFSTNNLSITRIGVDAGLDGILGTLDDIIYTSGPPTLRLHALFYRGVANWFEERSPANTGDVERYLATQKQPYFIRTTYVVANLGSATGMLHVQTAQQPAPPAPVITSFTATRTALMRGESASLIVHATGATKVVISGYGDAGAHSTNAVSPTATTSYVAVAVGSDGRQSQQASIQITVTVPQQPMTPSVTVGTSPSEIHAGETVSVGYSSSGATRVTFDGTDVPLSGTVTLTPTKTTTYTVIAYGSGSSIQATATVTVMASEPSAPALKLALGITPGTNVASGTRIRVEGFAQNLGTSTATTQTAEYQVSLHDKNTWSTLGSAGPSFSVSANTVATVSPYEWIAGPADNTVWDIRLAVTSGNQTFVSPTVSVRVVSGSVSLSIQQEGTSVKIQVKAPPGTYYLEDALQLTGPWLRGGEAITVTAGQVPEILYTRGDRLKGFFRVVHLP